MKLLKDRKNLIVVIIIAVLIILIGIVLIKMLVPGNNIYGNRLDEIVEVDNAVIEKIKEELGSREDISEITYLTNVKIMKFFITTSADNTTVEEFGTVIIDNLSEKALNYYDVEIYVTNESDETFPMIGYHSKSSSAFSWITNKEGEVNEE